MKELRDDLRAKIFGLDLESIKFKLMAAQGWSLPQVDTVEMAYKGFLYLAAKHPEVELTPTKPVDEMWHAHILDTRKYERDCADTVGKFMHHWPYSGLQGKADALAHEANKQATVKLVRQEFGAHAGQKWVELLTPTGAFNANCTSQCKCTTCYGSNCKQQIENSREEPRPDRNAVLALAASRSNNQNPSL